MEFGANLSSDQYYSESQTYDIRANSRTKVLFSRIWIGLFKESLDTIPHSLQQTISDIWKWYYQAEWFEVYDFIEFLSD